MDALFLVPVQLPRLVVTATATEILSDPLVPLLRLEKDIIILVAYLLFPYDVW